MGTLNDSNSTNAPINIFPYKKGNKSQNWIQISDYNWQNQHGLCLEKVDRKDGNGPIFLNQRKCDTSNPSQYFKFSSNAIRYK